MQGLLLLTRSLCLCSFVLVDYQQPQFFLSLLSVTLLKEKKYGRACGTKLLNLDRTGEKSSIQTKPSEIQGIRKFKGCDFPYNYNGTVKVKTTEKSVIFSWMIITTFLVHVFFWSSHRFIILSKWLTFLTTGERSFFGTIITKTSPVRYWPMLKHLQNCSQSQNV